MNENFRFASLSKGGTLLLYLGLSFGALILAFTMMVPPIAPQVIYLDEGCIRIAKGNDSPTAGLICLASPLAVNDRISAMEIPGYSEPIYVIHRAKIIQIVEHEKSWNAATTGRTVGDLIRHNAESINLGHLDRVEPSPDTKLSDGMAVTITRVTTKDEVREEPVLPHFDMIADSSLPRGRVKTIDHGKPGIKEVTYEKFYKNGELTLTKKKSEKVIKTATSGVKHIGSRVLTMSRSGYRGRRILEMEATAYDAGPLSTGKWADGITATGKIAKHGIVAVDPRVIPLGTKLFVEGYGYAVAEDIGGAIKGLRIDLFYESRTEALKFGRRDLTVYILEE